LVRVFRVFDKIRNEKMRNFVVIEHEDSFIDGPLDEIIKLADIEDGKQIIDMDSEELKALKKRIKELDSQLENLFLKQRKSENNC